MNSKNIRILLILVLWACSMFSSTSFAKTTPQSLSAQALDECNKGRSAKDRDVEVTLYVAQQP